MAYARTTAQRSSDFKNAREFEEEVGQHLGSYKIEQLNANDKLDFWVPAVYLDVKEKRQRLTERWQLLPGTPEADLFVVDELSVRRASRHGFSAYFLIRDCPQTRMFLARVDEVWSAERVRRNRAGKGKWILDLTNFRQIADLAGLMPMILADQVGLNWKRSECQSFKTIGEI